LSAAADPESFVDRQWMRPVGFPRRYDVRATRAREPRDGFRIYSPQRPLSRFRFSAGRLPFIRSCVAKRSGPPLQIDDLVRALGVDADGAVATRASAPDRWVIGLEAANKLVAVAKWGPLNDTGLRHEAEVLSGLDVDHPWIRLPTVLLAAEVAGGFVLVTQAVPPRTNAISLQQVEDVTTQLTNGVLGVAWVHGDLAQWNTVCADGCVWILDWEHSRPAREPLWDLTDHLFRESVLVGKYSPREVVRHLTATDSFGWSHLLAVGEDPATAPQRVLTYLDSRPPLGKSAATFEERMRRVVR
jgi:hypothetical protein